MRQQTIELLEQVKTNYIHTKGFAEAKLKRLSSEDLVGNTNIAKDFQEFTKQKQLAEDKLTDIDKCIEWLEHGKS